MLLILFMYDLHIKKVMHKKPKEKDDSDPVPVALGSKQVQEQQRCPGKASAPGKKSKKKPGKR